MPAEVMRVAFARRRAAFCAAAANATLVQLILQAIGAGLIVGPLGVDFERWVRNVILAGGSRMLPGTALANASKSAVTLATLEANAHFQAVRAAFFGQRGWSDVLAAAAVSVRAKREAGADYDLPAFAYPQRLLAADLPARHRARAPALAGTARSLYDRLSRDGFVRVNKWGEGVLDIGEIERVATRALDVQQRKQELLQSGRGGADVDGGAVVSARAPELAPLLAPLFRSGTPLRAVLDAYLGSDDALACSYGYTALRLNNGTSPANYVSSLWHHDRVGRRLKLFLFLHDVHPVEGRPTVVARGTHNFVWYSASGILDSRFDDAWIEANFETVPMGGKRGGGFLFDTNALHVGKWEGTNARSAVIVELDRQGRCRTLIDGPTAAGTAEPQASASGQPSAIRGKLHAPCPSSDRMPALDGGPRAADAVGAETIPRCAL